MNRPLVIAGHSHITSLGVPLQSSNGKNELVPLESCVTRDVAMEGFTGVWPRTQAYWDELLELSRDRTVALLWEGNQYHATFLFAPDPPIDFVLSEQPTLPVETDGHLVAELSIVEKLRSSLDGLANWLETANRFEHRPVLLVGTPPPNGNNQRLREYLVSDDFFLQLAARLEVDLETAPLCSPALRYKLWNLTQRMTRELAMRHGAEFLSVPAAVQDGAGCLKEEFWRDTTHANRAYGELVLADLAAWFLKQP